MQTIISARRVELQQQLDATRKRLTEAEQIVRQLSSGCMQLQARLDELDFLTNWEREQNGASKAQAASEAEAAL